MDTECAPVATVTGLYRGTFSGLEPLTKETPLTHDEVRRNPVFYELDLNPDKGRDLGRHGGGPGLNAVRKRRPESPSPAFWSHRMETELVAVLLGALLPLYPMLFAIYRKTGRYDEIVEEFKRLRDEHERWKEAYHG